MVDAVLLVLVRRMLSSFSLKGGCPKRDALLFVYVGVKMCQNRLVVILGVMDKINGFLEDIFSNGQN